MKQFFGIIIVILHVLKIQSQSFDIPTANNDTMDNKEVDNFGMCNLVLNFSNMQLSIIKPYFIVSPFVTSLQLRNNTIAKFEENTFQSLPHLEYLDLSNNILSMENLFSFGAHPTIKSLILDNNVIYPINRQDYYYRNCLDDEIWDPKQGCKKKYSKLSVPYYYPEINYLSLRNNYINSINNFNINFPKLVYLDLSNNYFEKSSNSFFDNIPNTVTKLILENVNLKKLRSQNLRNIKYLNLNNNFFETLSNYYCYENTLCLQDMDNLESLFLSSCSIKKIEVDAFKNLKNLTNLDLSNNMLREIPDRTFEFTLSLSSLNMSRNPISEIPDISMLKNLTILIMDGIKNMSIFENFSTNLNLKILSLRDNELTTLSFLNNFPSLNELNLSNNKIKILPSWQSQNNLRKLFLNNNEVSSIEDLSLNEAENLEIIELQNNSISSIKLSSLKKLPETAIIKL